MVTPAPDHRTGSGLRVLVTGSRTWDDPAAITAALDDLRASLPPGQILTVVHGANRRGADAAADAWAIQHRAEGVRLERHPADWRAHGKAAGMIRNTEMTSSGADACLAFIRDQSPGASHCAAQAERSGIPVHRFGYAASTHADDAADATSAAAVPAPPAAEMAFRGQGELFQLPADDQEWSL